MMVWSAVAAIPLPDVSKTALSSMSSWGSVMAAISSRWVDVRVTVNVASEWLLVAVSSRVMPSDDSPVSRICRRS